MLNCKHGMIEGTCMYCLDINYRNTDKGNAYDLTARFRTESNKEKLRENLRNARDYRKDLTPNYKFQNDLNKRHKKGKKSA